mmetsp:Transcript_68188/g.154263  ORF Transcript_68188/g.154263 Transcript_68188/m.154263 type:complete len:303 (+) Transcript_68188:216-1124(+)
MLFFGPPEDKDDDDDPATVRNCFIPSVFTLLTPCSPLFTWGALSLYRFLKIAMIKYLASKSSIHGGAGLKERWRAMYIHQTPVKSGHERIKAQGFEVCQESESTLLVVYKSDDPKPGPFSRVGFKQTREGNPKDFEAMLGVIKHELDLCVVRPCGCPRSGYHSADCVKYDPEHPEASLIEDTLRRRPRSEFDPEAEKLLVQRLRDLEAQGQAGRLRRRVACIRGETGHLFEASDGAADEYSYFHARLALTQYDLELPSGDWLSVYHRRVSPFCSAGAEESAEPSGELDFAEFSGVLEYSMVL